MGRVFYVFAEKYQLLRKSKYNTRKFRVNFYSIVFKYRNDSKPQPTFTRAHFNWRLAKFHWWRGFSTVICSGLIVYILVSIPQERQLYELISNAFFYEKLFWVGVLLGLGYRLLKILLNFGFFLGLIYIRNCAYQGKGIIAWIQKVNSRDG